MRSLVFAVLALAAGQAAAQQSEATFVRPTAFIGNDSTYYVVLDGKPLYDLQAREHVRFAVAPGAHALAVRCPKALYAQYAETTLQHDFKAGEQAYFLVEPKFDCVAITALDAREGKSLVSSTSARPASRAMGYEAGKVQAAAPIQTMETDSGRDAVSTATAAWVEAFNSRDASRLGALYDPEAVLWGANAKTMTRGAAAIGRYFGDEAPTRRVALGEREVRVYGDTAVDTGTYTFFEMRDGKAVTTPERYTLVYRNAGGKWLIVDHHSSLAPR